jgi:hypothetical protein
MCSAERKFAMIYISKTQTTHAGITKAGLRGGLAGAEAPGPSKVPK